jgi:hypothetical protein
MKETIEGLQEALNKKGINIKLKPKLSREKALIEANKIDIEIQDKREESLILYQQERKLYYSRLKISQCIGQLARARREILGLKEIKTYKEIDEELKKEMGVKNE